MDRDHGADHDTYASIPPGVSHAPRLQRAWLVLLLTAPIVLVVIAYGWLAVDHGAPFLWNVVVHEGGHYTFGQAVLFFRHFLREVPVDIAMAISIAAGVRLVAPRAVPVTRYWFMGLAILLVAVALAVAASEEGWWEAVRDLLQYRTRDDDTRYGSHWRFHLLSTIWFCGAAPLLAGISAGVPGVPRALGAGRRLLIASWLWVAVLTIAFGLTTEPFTSDRYIGHQAREILTHGLITLPFTVGLCAILADGPLAEKTGRDPSMPLQALSWFIVAAIPVFLVTAFGGATLETSAQLNSGLSGVVAAHVFEHLLDYIFVLAVVLALVGRGQLLRR